MVHFTVLLEWERGRSTARLNTFMNGSGGGLFRSDSCELICFQLSILCALTVIETRNLHELFFGVRSERSFRRNV